ncbi:MAG: FmdE family protein [Desulfobacterales bacterium]|nr:FmdE family protein [Desulfobacterales bacterium]MDX2511853.1 FmdE family protein [Desulfobacterales bacterium]
MQKKDTNGPITQGIKRQEPSAYWCSDHKGKRYTFEESLEMARAFHGYPAPGLIIGVRMVSLAMQQLPENILFDAVSETRSCLPDAVQVLTLCTVGNNWLKVMDLGRYALALYDKFTGKGVRVSIDSLRLKKWPELYAWLYKTKAKHEQDSEALYNDIQTAARHVLNIENIVMQSRYLKKISKGTIDTCPGCGEAFPLNHGKLCRVCQGETPYRMPDTSRMEKVLKNTPAAKRVSTEQAVGKRLIHDMTEIIPGEKKGPAFRQGQIIKPGDICRLQRMGRQHVYVEDDAGSVEGFIHEDQAALAFAKGMAGEGVTFQDTSHEGKIELTASADGLYDVDIVRLEMFNQIPGVMCASRKRFDVIQKGNVLAATRAIPLFLAEDEFERAMAVLRSGSLFRIRPIRKVNVGILVTGTEVFRGLVQDSFIPIIKSKVEKFASPVVDACIVPDDRAAITEGVNKLIKSGADLIVTTAGLSVDPDDVTRQGLMDAGCIDLLYGAPILPGAMTLLSRIGDVQVIGVPACGLFHKTTSFDILLPRLLAGLTITRKDLAVLGHGALCLDCPTCIYPDCSFGK